MRSWLRQLAGTGRRIAVVRVNVPLRQRLAAKHLFAWHEAAHAAALRRLPAG